MFGALELWVVFRDEGTSLRRFLYSPHERPPAPPSPPSGRRKAGGSSSSSSNSRGDKAVLFEPSEFWRQLRTAEGGPEVIRALLRQVVEGAAEVHAAGAAHRDLKVRRDGGGGGGGWRMDGWVGVGWGGV